MLKKPIIPCLTLSQRLPVDLGKWYTVQQVTNKRGLSKLSRMRTYYFRIRRGHLIDCNSVPKLYRRGALLLLYNYKVKGVGPTTFVYGGVRIRPSL